MPEAVHPKFKLGKQPPKYDRRTLQFEQYVDHATLGPRITLPRMVNWGTKVKNWPMMMNDTIGDCTIASKGHLVQEWSTNTGNPVIIPDEAILKAYEDVSGYVPGDPSTDNGAVMLDVLNYFRHTGIGGHNIFAYVALEPGNTTHVQEGIYLFGAVDIGLALPLSAQNQVGRVWSVVSGPESEPGSWGGHCVPVIHYDFRFQQMLYCVTWGRIQPMTIRFFQKYCDEAYALLSEQDWINKKGVDPSGFNFQELEKDLNSIQH